MKKRGFTLVELLVVVAIIAILLAILMPAMTKAREQSKSIICKSYVKQWGLMLTMYTNANNGHFMEGFNVTGGMWMTKLRTYYNGADKIRLCPKAVTFLSTTSMNTDPFTAWGVYGDQGYANSWIPAWGEKGFYGSFGINSWIHDPPTHGDLYDIDDDDVPYYWRTIGKVKNPSIVPTICDSVWEGTTVRPADVVPNKPGVSNSPDVKDGMWNFFIPRHDMYIDMTFVDGSAKKVPITSLWNTYKWSQNFAFREKKWLEWVIKKKY